MKIGIASEGKDENSNVSEVSGRAPFFLIFENKKLVKVISNPFKTGGGGAGFGVAKMLSKEGVKIIIAGMFGKNITEYLKEKEIKPIQIKGETVMESLEKCQDQEDVEG